MIATHRTPNAPADLAVLTEFARHYEEPPELRTGDLVTARRVSFPALHGRMFVVLEHRPDAEPVDVAGPMLPAGGRPEVRVAVVDGGVVQTLWAERHAFEAWPDGPARSAGGMSTR